MKEVPVIISGAGPVGLTTLIQLARFGIPALLLERRAGVSTLPRARGIMCRTVEIWSRYGLYDEMTAFSLPANWCERFVYVDTLAGEIIGFMPSNSAAAGAQSDNTAYDFRCAAQDRIDTMLWRHALTYPQAQIRFSTELVGYRQDEDGVTVTLKTEDGGLEEVRTQWLIAADGGRSPLRDMAGIAMTGPTNLRSLINNHFDADLSPWTAGREAVLQWTMAPNLVGSFQPLDGKQRWMCQIALNPGEDLEDWPRERVIRRLQDMVGAPGEPPQIDLHSSYIYTVNACVADRFRDRRLLLVGDAAHRIPPAGGIGMNTGVQTAHNLVWKLAAVIAGAAPDALLDTFDTERREVAKRACDYGATNIHFIANIESAPTREAQREAVAASKQYGNWAGLDLGVHYEGHGAFVPDDTPFPATAHAVIDYQPSAKPGFRAPHLWLRRGEERLSSIDLFERDFVLLTGAAGAAWVAAARGLAGPLPIVPYRIAADGDLIPDRDFASLYGIAEDGAVLVRPDGHVAWRSPGMADNTGAALRRALDASLMRPSREL